MIKQSQVNTFINLIRKLNKSNRSRKARHHFFEHFHRGENSLAKSCETSQQQLRSLNDKRCNFIKTHLNQDGVNEAQKLISKKNSPPLQQLKSQIQQLKMKTQPQDLTKRKNFYDHYRQKMQLRQNERILKNSSVNINSSICSEMNSQHVLEQQINERRSSKRFTINNIDKIKNRNPTLQNYRVRRILKKEQGRLSDEQPFIIIDKPKQSQLRNINRPLKLKRRTFRQIKKSKPDNGLEGQKKQLVFKIEQLDHKVQGWIFNKELPQEFDKDDDDIETFLQ